jgi:hypothetical protein
MRDERGKGEVKSPALKNRGQGTQSPLRIYRPGHPSGKLADLVLVEGNPAEKISDIRRCRLVVKNGLLFKSDAVYAAVGIKPAD